MAIDAPSIIEAFTAEIASVRSAAQTRNMGHTSYVTKANLKASINNLGAMRSLLIRANGMNDLPDDIETLYQAVTTLATQAASS